MNDTEVWKIKEHVCTACGKDLERGECELYRRDDSKEGVDNVDLMCERCYDDLRNVTRGRSETEEILEEIEQDMPEASRERKTLEYLRRFGE